MKYRCLSAEEERLVLPSVVAWGVWGDRLQWGAHTREHECHHSFAPRDWWDLANNSKS